MKNMRVSDFLKRRLTNRISFKQNVICPEDGSSATFGLTAAENPKEEEEEASAWLQSVTMTSLEQTLPRVMHYL